MNEDEMDIYIQDMREQQENDRYMGDECLFDMSMGVDPHQIQSDETDTNTVQSPLHQHGPPGPPYGTMSRLAFQAVPLEPGTNGQDSGEDEYEGDASNDIVTFAPDVEPGTPPVDDQHRMSNSLLQTVEEARKLDQMRRIDDLGSSILN
jgi:hypothetical protein